MLLVPICEECFKKIIEERESKVPERNSEKKDEDPIRERPIIPPPKQEPGMSVKEYFRRFEIYIFGMDLPIDTENKNILFVHGLSDENNAEVANLPFLSDRFESEDFISNTVCYLSSIEDFKNAVFGKKS
jgi:hypothetical protein